MHKNTNFQAKMLKQFTAIKMPILVVIVYAKDYVHFLQNKFYNIHP